jgi:phosphoglycerol transferase MdoB-like AlkP superfamily enzyme
MKIEQIVRGLNTYRGRDACVRSVCYLLLFLYATLKPLNSSNDDKRLNILLSASKQFGQCRMILRFFEDIPAFLNLYLFLSSKVFLVITIKNLFNEFELTF